MLDARGNPASAAPAHHESTERAEPKKHEPADPPAPSEPATTIRFRRTDIAQPVSAEHSGSELPAVPFAAHSAAPEASSAVHPVALPVVLDDPDPRAALISLQPTTPASPAPPEPAPPCVREPVAVEPRVTHDREPVAIEEDAPQPGTSTGGSVPQARAFVRRDERTVQREQLRARAAELRAARAQRIDRSSLRE